MSTRKTVTVVFCDVVDSTRRAEQLDPEQVRATMNRYFSVARDVLEGHGGTVEKFIGDAVMAVFGIPTLHEDDAVRALRASLDLLSAVRQVEYDLPSGEKLPVDVRIGVNSGEVVAADDGTEGGALVTGDAVNVAARLQQAAQPGEALVGEATRRLARGSATLEAVAPIEAKGKSDSVAAYRLVSVARDAARKPDTTPLVGRSTELAQLHAALDAVEASRRPQLVTVVGTAGVGKSRLVAELLNGAELTASILRGRCLPYGNGVTYFPLTQLVRSAAGITDTDDRADARAKLEALSGSDAVGTKVAAAIASATGVDSLPVQSADIHWAARRLLERLASDRPLVVVFEDIHWAEPAFLDLIEYLSEFITNAAVLLVCLARPELYEHRPSWGRTNAASSVVTLDALPVQAASDLFDLLPGSAAVPAALRRRILEAAEGNPLYVEEMLGMLVDDGRLVADGNGWRISDASTAIDVPPTIGALLAARIDGLPEHEREVAERASVIGRVFEASAVRELVSEDLSEDIGSNLLALVRKEFIRPERAELSLGDAYKFRHILIRDAAYRALPKLDRAELHEGFADWLERASGDRVEEYAEILGFHFEQAYGYRVELGLRDDRAASIADRAATWLWRASERASIRRDEAAHNALVERTIRLTPQTAPLYPKLLISKAEAVQGAGDYERALDLLDQVLALPDVAAGDRARARLDRPFFREDIDLVTIDDLRCEMAASIRPLLRAGERRAVMNAFRWLASSYQNGADTEMTERYLMKAARLGRVWGFADHEAEILLNRASLGSRTAMPVGEAIALCEESMSLPGFSRGLLPFAYDILAYLEAQRGRFEQAYLYLEEDERSAREAGQLAWVPQIAATRGLVERFARRFDQAALAFQASYEEHARTIGGTSWYLVFLGARSAQALADGGRWVEARATLDEIKERLDARDRWTTTIAGGTEARILTFEGRVDEGFALAKYTVEHARAERLDRLVILFANALEDLAACADAAGDKATAQASRAEAFAMYDAKGTTVEADRLRPLLMVGSPGG